MSVGADEAWIDDIAGCIDVLGAIGQCSTLVSNKGIFNRITGNQNRSIVQYSKAFSVRVEGNDSSA